MADLPGTLIVRAVAGARLTSGASYLQVRVSVVDNGVALRYAGLNSAPNAHIESLTDRAAYPAALFSWLSSGSTFLALAGHPRESFAFPALSCAPARRLSQDLALLSAC